MLRDKEEQGGVRRSEAGEGEQGEQDLWVWLKTQGCQRRLKAPKVSWGSREVPGAQGCSRSKGSKEEQGGVRGEGEQGEQGLWVWLKTQGCQRLTRLSEAPGRSQGSRDAQGSRWSEWSEGTWGGARGTRPLSLTEDPRLPKASKGSQPWLPEAPGRSQGPRDAQGQGGKGDGEQREHGPWVWLKTQGCQRLPKALKASWGPREVPEAQGGSGCEGQGKQGEEESKGKRPLSLTADPRMLKASEGSKGFLSPKGGPVDQGRLRGQWEKREQGVYYTQF